MLAIAPHTFLILDDQPRLYYSSVAQIKSPACAGHTDKAVSIADGAALTVVAS